MNQPAGSEFRVFADESREWAERTHAAGFEGWPDDDWAGFGFDRRNEESASGG